MKLNHVLLTVNNVDEFVDFFEKVVGLKEGLRPDFPFKGAWIYDENNMPAIHLSQREKLAKGKYTANVLSNESSHSEIGTVFNHVSFTENLSKHKDFVDKMDKLNVVRETNYVPNTDIVQEFVMGPEGLVVEIQFE